jgi:hypothetical protein
VYEEMRSSSDRHACEACIGGLKALLCHVDTGYDASIRQLLLFR